MNTATKVILIASSIVIPGAFISTLFEWDWLVELQTINYGTIILPNFIAGALFFWGIVLLIYGIYDLIKSGILKLKNFINKKRTA